jgi:hypothetical protein
MAFEEDITSSKDHEGIAKTIDTDMFFPLIDEALKGYPPRMLLSLLSMLLPLTDCSI